MARKANSKTPNKELVMDILDDQIAMGIPHLSIGKIRTTRLYHNVKELYRRLGEKVEPGELLYYG